MGNLCFRQNSAHLLRCNTAERGGLFFGRFGDFRCAERQQTPALGNSKKTKHILNHMNGSQTLINELKYHVLTSLIYQ